MNLGNIWKSADKIVCVPNTEYMEYMMVENLLTYICVLNALTGFSFVNIYILNVLSTLPSDF